MNKVFSVRDMDILTTYQGASTPHVFPSLRFASVTLEEYPEIYFCVHGNLSWDDHESLNLMDTYFGVGFSSRITQGSFDVIRIDAPTPIAEYPGECVYTRREEGPLLSVKQKIQFDPSVNLRAKIFFSLQQAMINNVFPEMRSVYVTWDELSITPTFIVDGDLSENNKQSLKCIHNDFVTLFPEIISNIQSFRLDFPQRNVEEYGPIVYAKKEYFEDDSTRGVLHN